MNLLDFVNTRLKWLKPHHLARLERYLRKLPFVQDEIEREYKDIMAGLEAVLKPYKDQFPAHQRLPYSAREREEIISEMMAINAMEENRWKEGYISGAVYHGDQDHISFLNKVYALNSQSNPLHSDVWPSTAKYEAEVVSMAANMLGAEAALRTNEPDNEICGTVTSGGTESILLAMKTYRDWALQVKGIRNPEIVAPETAHAAFEKAARYFNIKLVTIPVDTNYKADLKAAKKAINRHTIALIGSAPAFPHGTIDPIQELSEIARKQKIGFHTDACLGGFVLPWAEQLGYPVPPFDFRLPGVTSISVDTHKYGYAAKGTSVILYRGTKLRQHQYFTAVDWPGGLYFSPTFAGSRPGGLSAACWAAMLSIGEEGYLAATRKILETAAFIRQGIEAIPGLDVLGDPLWVIAFASPNLDIYRILDFMTTRKWSLNGLHNPPALHICVTLRHTLPGVADKFLKDLRSAVTHVQETPQGETGMAPIYGMAATLPFRGIVSDLLKKYIDLLYKV